MARSYRECLDDLETAFVNHEKNLPGLKLNREFFTPGLAKKIEASANKRASPHPQNVRDQFESRGAATAVDELLGITRNDLQKARDAAASSLEREVAQTAQQGLETAPEPQVARIEDRGGKRITTFEGGDLLSDFALDREPTPSQEGRPPEAVPTSAFRVDEDGRVTVGKRAFSAKKDVPEEQFQKAVNDAGVSNAMWEHMKQQNPGIIKDGKVDRDALREAIKPGAKPLVEVEVHGQEDGTEDNRTGELQTRLGSLQHELETKGFTVTRNDFGERVVFRGEDTIQGAEDPSLLGSESALIGEFEEVLGEIQERQEGIGTEDLNFAARNAETNPDTFVPYDEETGLGNVAFEVRAPGVTGGEGHTGNEDTLGWVRGKFIEEETEGEVETGGGQIKWDRRGVGSVPKQVDLNYFGFSLPMLPGEFRKMTPEGRSGPGSPKFLKDKVKSGEAIAPPWLDIKWNADRKVWVVDPLMHEGRSRSDVAAELDPGVRIPVSLFPIGMRARNVTEEMRNAPFVLEDDLDTVVFRPTKPTRKIFRADEVQSDAAQGAAKVAGKFAGHPIRFETNLNGEKIGKITITGNEGDPNVGDTYSLSEEAWKAAGVKQLDRPTADQIIKAHHPLFSEWERIVTRVAMAEAKARGATAFFVPNANTAMMTEGHDRAIATREPRHEPGVEMEFPELRRAGGNPNITGRVRVNPAGFIQVQVGQAYRFPRDVLGGNEVLSAVESRVPLDKPQPTEAPGMRAAYGDPTTNTVGRLPSLAAKLTGDKGTEVDLGRHGKSPIGKEKVLPEEQQLNPPRDEQGRPLATIFDEKAENRTPVLLNPDGTPATNITGKLFSLENVAETSRQAAPRPAPNIPQVNPAREVARRISDFIFNPEKVAETPGVDVEETVPVPKKAKEAQDEAFVNFDQAVDEFYNEARESVQKDPERISAEKIARDSGVVLGPSVTQDEAFEGKRPPEAQSIIDGWKQQAKNAKRSGSKVILSLFDSTGNWARPWIDAGYEVIQIDLNILNEGAQGFEMDIFDVTPQFLTEELNLVVHGVLAACPCTTFSGAGARWKQDKFDASTPEAKQHFIKTFGEKAAAEFDTMNDYTKAMVEHTLDLIEFMAPDFWALENPVGRLKAETSIPLEGLQFQPHNYGDPFTKRTQIFGKFDAHLPQANVEPTGGSYAHNLRGTDPDAKKARSDTFEGFAYAFFMANHGKHGPDFDPALGGVPENLLDEQAQPAAQPEADLPAQAESPPVTPEPAVPAAEGGAETGPEGGQTGSPPETVRETVQEGQVALERRRRAENAVSSYFGGEVPNGIFFGRTQSQKGLAIQSEKGEVAIVIDPDRFSSEEDVTETLEHELGHLAYEQEQKALEEIWDSLDQVSRGDILSEVRNVYSQDEVTEEARVRAFATASAKLRAANPEGFAGLVQRIQQFLRKTLGLTTDADLQRLVDRVLATGMSRISNSPFLRVPDVSEIASVKESQGKTSFSEQQRRESARRSSGEALMVRAHAAVGPSSADLAAKVKETKTLFQKTGEGAAEFFEPVSTTLGNIHPELVGPLRALDWGIAERSSNYLKRAEEFLKFSRHLGRISKKKKTELEILLYNGEFDEVRSTLAGKPELGHFEDVVSLLEDIASDLKDSGREFGTLPNYYPRQVKDYEQFQKFLSIVHGFDPSGMIQKEIKKEEAKHGGVLSEFERADVANNVLLGVRGGSVKVPSNLKRRIIDLLDKESVRFYHDMNQSLIGYIRRISEDISTRSLFGRGYDFEANTIDSKSTVGGVVADLLERGEITPVQERKIYDVFRDRLSYRPTGNILGGIRDLGYIATMGSPISALTQIGDLAWSAIENGVYTPQGAVLSLGRKVGGKKGVNRRDLHFEHIATEMSEEGGLRKALNTTFKAVGLDLIDSIGKETLANSSLAKWQRRSLDQIKTEFAPYGPYMQGSLDEFASDLKAGNITHDVRFALWTKVLDYQPVALSEMPRAYLRSPKGRVLYMLKTFTVKQFDVLRRKGIDRMAKGLRDGNAKEAAAGFSTLMGTALVIMAAQAGADELKDWVLGRDGDLSDRVVDNLLRLVGLSKFSTYRFKEGDITGGIMSIVLPPHFSLGNTAVIDTKKIFKALEEGEPVLETIGDSKSATAVPVVGKILYWRHGGGVEASAKERGRRWREDLSDETKGLLDELKTLRKIGATSKTPAQSRRFTLLNQLNTIVLDRQKRVEKLPREERETYLQYQREIDKVSKSEKWRDLYTGVLREKAAEERVRIVKERLENESKP